MNYVEAILHHAKSAPNKTAITLADRMVTFRMVGEGILNIEQRVQALGLDRNDVVAVMMSNQIRDVIVSAALHRAGIVSVSIDTAKLLSASGLRPAAVLTDIADAVGDLETAIKVEDDWFYGDADVQAAAPLLDRFGPDDVCRIIFSSGTTGAPRPMAYSERILTQRLHSRILMSASDGSDKSLILPTLASQIGWTGALTALVSGGTAAFADDSEVALRMIDIYGLRSMLATAGQVREITALQGAGRIPTGSLRAVHVGAGFMSDQLLRDTQRLVCPNLVCRYGSTETGVAALGPAEAIAGIPGAVGYVAPWASIVAADSAGAPLPHGETGELLVNTHAHCPVFKPGLTRIFLTETAFRSGDIGMVRPDGLLILTGRVTDVINAGGVKIAPERIEEMVLRTEKVRDVAAVSGVGASGIEEVWIAVVAADGFDAEAAGHRIADANPGLGLVRFSCVSEIPRNQAGKILREKLRKDFAAAN